MLIVSGLNLENTSLVARERAAGEVVYIEPDDRAAMQRLHEQAHGYDKASHDGRRLECYLLLESLTSLWLLQTLGIDDQMMRQVDVFATTVDDLMAKTVLVRLPSLPVLFPSLDRTPIGRDSDTVVHLVLMGFTPMAEALAVNAALVAHYPNYCRDTRLRTRITVIDPEVYAGRDRMVQRYRHLFDHTYYRTLNLGEAKPHCVVHRPVYEALRKDFVDIEWEFVRGDARNQAVRQKLIEWSGDPHQQLTLAVCHDDAEQCLDEAFGMPQEVYQAAIPILCRTSGHDVLGMLDVGKHYPSVFPINERCCSIDTLRTLKSLAQCVNYVYNHCFNLEPQAPITAPAAIDRTALEPLWQQVGSLPKQYSNIFNAMTLGTKMHSLGHTAESWAEYYALTAQEIDLLTEVEHNRWSVEELILGYRPVNDDEQRMVEQDISLKRALRDRKVHYDLRAFDDLRDDVTGRNVNIYDMALTQAIPLIIKTCITD